MDAPRACIVIPARMHSTRLPGKMLLRETGRTLIEHTHEAASRSRRAAAVVIATDHEAIYQEVRRFGGTAVMTSPDHASGADRVAEVARRTPGYDLFVNVQGDEPEVDPEAIDRLISLFDDDTDTPMATLATPIRAPDRVVDPSNVKVVFDDCGRALYFSRSPIPFVRDAGSATEEATEPLFHQHLGLYAYRPDFLQRLADLPASPLEQAEKLEQLRVLQAGHTIRVAVVSHACSGIDTAADYAAFVRRHCRLNVA